MSVQHSVHASGVIVACAWDDRHRVRAVALSTTAESELQVSEDAGRGSELRAWMHRRVTVSGYLDEAGRLVIADFSVDEDR